MPFSCGHRRICHGCSCPSGIGAFHYIISRGLAFVQGVNLEDGALYAILTHESQLILIIIIGTISTYLIFRKTKKLTRIKTRSVTMAKTKLYI
jgi:hypothetical protein